MEAENKEESWFKDIKTEPTDLVGTGKKLILGAFGVFLMWALFIPISSAIVTQGMVVSKGKNKVLQHPVGGVVLAINALEGDHVKAGQVLYILDPAADQAELTRLRARQVTLHALKARLEAEKRFSVDPSVVKFASFKLRGIRGDVNIYPADFSVQDQTEENASIANAVFQEQQREFETGRQAIKAELAAMMQKTKALQKRKSGFRQRINSVSKQVYILQKQLASARSLVRDGHIAQQRAWDIENQLLSRKSELATIESEYGSIANQIEETRAQFERVKHNDEKTTSGQLTEVLGELNQIRDKYKAVKAAVENTEIRAPVDGILLHSAIATIGGVAKPGEVIGEIVPVGGELEMRVRVKPSDISHVHINQTADIKITAFNSRIFDALSGKVTYVAADATSDPETMQQFFRVGIRFDAMPNGSNGLPMVTPGMNGDVFLQRESRTFVSYLLQPLFESFSYAFTEK